MQEGILNVLKNKSENICITWSEIKYVFCTPQAADENFNNNAKENSNNSDNSSDENEMAHPHAMDSVLSLCSDDCRCANCLAMSSRNACHEDRQETSQNGTHYEMCRHLGCTNNATYGIESSSSESELPQPKAAADVELELELLSLVTELMQDRQATKAACCHKCCHGNCSRNFGFLISGDDLANNNPNPCCVKHRHKEDATFRSTEWKHVPINKDQKRRHTESCGNVMITQTTAARSVSGSPGFSGADVDVDFNKCPLFAGDNVNKSSHFTSLSATQTDTAHLVKQKSCQEVYRESKDNYIPAKYWERQKLTSVRAEEYIPLCPTTENYRATAARDPVINPFQVSSYANSVCLEQSCNNTYGCNNATCGNSGHIFNTSSYNRFQQAGNYVDHTKSKASVCNANMAANCSKIHRYFDGMWESPEKSINQKLTPLNTLFNTRLASSEKVKDSGRQSEYNMCLNSTDNKNKQQMELSYPPWYIRMQSIMQQTNLPQQYINDQSNSNKFQRIKHSRNCRRRRGMDGATFCNKCLPMVPFDAHSSLRDNTTEKINSLDNHKKSKGRSLKHFTNRSKNTRLSSNRRRTTNTKLRHSGRTAKYAVKRHQNRRSTSMRLRRRSPRSAYPRFRHQNYKRRSTGVRHHIMKSRRTRQVSSRRRSRHKS